MKIRIRKILFITSNDHVPWGGSEELWLECAKEALIKKIQVAICVEWNPLPLKIKYLKKFSNLKLFSINSKKNLITKIKNKFFQINYQSKIEFFREKLFEWQPDLTIISQGNNADGLPLIDFCNEQNFKYVTISQAVYEGIWPDTNKASRMLNGYTKALGNYFVSEANLKITNLQIGMNVHNGKVVRNPFNISYNNELPFPNISIFKFACVARYEFYAKGQDVLLEVLNAEKWKKRNIQVTFYGSGPNEENIRRLISYLGLVNVNIGGYKQTTDIWKENHVLLLPSRFEGLPLALVEAMLAGRFGIVTNVGGNKEVFIDEESGFLAEAPKAEYFDKAMEKAWQRRYEWKAIGNKAKQFIKTLIPENPGKELLNFVIDDYHNYCDN